MVRFGYLCLLLMGLVFDFALHQPPSAEEAAKIESQAAVNQEWGWMEPKFSPNGGCTAQIVRAIKQCKKIIRIQAYSYTSVPIEEALEEAHKNGVLVCLILDKTDDVEGEKNLAYRAHTHHLSLQIDRVHAIAHNKIIILDDMALLTGSFNFTEQAEKRNAENSVPILKQDYVKVYIQNWKDHLTHSTPYKP